MTDFNKSYALLCAAKDAVIVIQVHVSLKTSFRHLAILFFFFLNLKLIKIFPFRVKLYEHGLRYMELFFFWKIWAKITPAEFCPE